MSRFTQYPVIDPEGTRGVVVAVSRFLDDEQQKLIRLQDGQEFFVDSSLLQPLDDNTYRLKVPVNQILARVPVEGTPRSDDQAVSAEPRIIPIIEERLEVGTHKVLTGTVRVHKYVEEAETVVDEPLVEESWDVERVPVNRVLTGAPPEPRHEGDTLVLPVLEEVLVVEKRLVLREEMRLTRKRREIREPQRHTVRQERLEVERVR